MTPPPPTQNLNASLSRAEQAPSRQSTSGESWKATPIHSYSPPVRIIGTGRRSYSGGYRINV